MNKSDRSYHIRRAEQQLDRAQGFSHPKALRAQYQLANGYLHLAYGLRSQKEAEQQASGPAPPKRSDREAIRPSDGSASKRQQGRGLVSQIQAVLDCPRSAAGRNGPAPDPASIGSRPLPSSLSGDSRK